MIPPPPRILALDLSLTATGFCAGLCTDGALGDISSGVHRTGHLRGHERIADIRRILIPMVRNSGLVVIEGYSFGSQGRAVFDIAELGGVIRHEIYLRYIPWIDIPPASLKKFATGKGNAKKIDMVIATRERFGFTASTNDNECDAYLLWALAMQAYGHPVAKAPALQAEVVARIAWPEIGVVAT